MNMAIKPIGWDNIGKLGIDETTGRLYYGDEEVAVRKGFFLLPLERKIAIVAAAAASITALVNLTRFMLLDLKVGWVVWLFS